VQRGRLIISTFGDRLTHRAQRSRSTLGGDIGERERKSGVQRSIPASIKERLDSAAVKGQALDLCQELFLADGARSDEEDAVLQNTSNILLKNKDEQLRFTEKDHSKDNKPDFNAAFGKFGSALIISLHDDGEIFACQVVHSAHQKQGFSSIGSIRTNDFTFENGKVQGELTTDGAGRYVWRDMGGENQVCRSARRDPERVSARRVAKAGEGRGASRHKF
jgi:hypothetical protein